LATLFLLGSTDTVHGNEHPPITMAHGLHHTISGQSTTFRIAGFIAASDGQYRDFRIGCGFRVRRKRFLLRGRAYSPSVVELRPLLARFGAHHCDRGSKILYTFRKRQRAWRTSRTLARIP